MTTNLEYLNAHEAVQAYTKGECSTVEDACAKFNVSIEVFNEMLKYYTDGKQK